MSLHKQQNKKWRKWIYIAIIAAIYIWAFSQMPAFEIQAMAGEISRSILNGLFNPDWDFVYDPGGEDLLRGLLDTLAIAFLGTIVSAVLCIPFAFWAARNLHRYKFIPESGTFILSVIRTFPEIVMAILFIKAVGPGAFAGVLALGIHSIGMLGKLYSEAIETIDDGPIEALTASGANRLQILWFAVVPQVIPAFLSYTLYRFEINLRSATILGIIGAGGIGTPLIFAITSRDWDRVGIILLGIIVMVMVLDFLSGLLRKRIV
ncbi:phosphonate ABC transporter, permease protein PhnE [Hazenella sp. IB182357]|uniref:Phosphonate ABC transporter, permease protein PhnE n=1 Tax=Polycladospora coralii TaxID=2771432 RepID=A0A926N7J9_9BACL|nr:phosphonate ABC transporter, permease protein PhnE [Polycladospora coralii]MBD1371481.1 phosphonate ABC transporter, permease protein PhnE [Polycladospora coralii]MBS7530449.1 phosphonate ABC transporter, permease protein PhnE [Polycladospora coralii]